MTPTRTRFIVVSNELHACPYLPGRVACTPLRFSTARLRHEEFDRLLAEGDRRAGPLLYRTECPECTACEALRVPVKRFAPTKSQRKVCKRNDGDVRVEVGPALADARRVEIYNRHRNERGLARADDIDEETYRQHYVESCTDTREVRYFVGDKLIALSILDFGRTSVSSVYHCFDPDESWRSMGVYSVLKEVALCAEAGFDWYYLGLWVGDCANLSYKAQYYPHERLQGGVWKSYERAAQRPE